MTQRLQPSDINAPKMQIAESLLDHLRTIFQARVDFDKLLEIVEHLEHLE